MQNLLIFYRTIYPLETQLRINISRHGRWFLRNVEEIMQKMRLTLQLFTALYLLFNRKGNLEISTNISVGIVFLQKNKRFFSVFRFTMLLISWMVDHKRNYRVKGIVRSKTKNHWIFFHATAREEFAVTFLFFHVNSNT